tara:strand:- start:1962 stop:2483 length:522 start_codon:yes stop_codon:yes gene_type:complete
MKVVDIASEIYEELGRPSSLSIPSISFWLRNNIGGLNNYINTQFSIASDDFEIIRTVDSAEAEISVYEKAVFKKMYFVHYYDQQIRVQLASSDNVVEVSQDGMSVRKVNKTEVIRHLTAIKKQENDELMAMVNAYKTNKAAPRQVAGDDTQQGTYYDDSYGIDYERTRRKYFF